MYFYSFYLHKHTLVQSKYEFTDICIYTLYWSPADHRHDHTSSYYGHPKKFSVLPPDGSSFLTLEFPPTKAGFPLQGRKGIVRGSRKVWNLIFFGKSQGKVRKENFYPSKVLTFYICMQKCVQLNCIWQSVVYKMLLFESSIKMI